MKKQTERCEKLRGKPTVPVCIINNLLVQTPTEAGQSPVATVSLDNVRE